MNAKFELEILGVSGSPILRRNHPRSQKMHKNRTDFIIPEPVTMEDDSIPDSIAPLKNILNADTQEPYELNASKVNVASDERPSLVEENVYNQDINIISSEFRGMSESPNALAFRAITQQRKSPLPTKTVRVNMREVAANAKRCRRHQLRRISSNYIPKPQTIPSIEVDEILSDIDNDEDVKEHHTSMEHFEEVNKLNRQKFSERDQAALKLGRMIMGSILNKPEITTADSLSRFFFDAWLSQYGTTSGVVDSLSVDLLCYMQRVSNEVKYKCEDEDEETYRNAQKVICSAACSALDRLITECSDKLPILKDIRDAILPCLFISPPPAGKEYTLPNVVQLGSGQDKVDGQMEVAEETPVDYGDLKLWCEDASHVIETQKSYESKLSAAEDKIFILQAEVSKLVAQAAQEKELRETERERVSATAPAYQKVLPAFSAIDKSAAKSESMAVSLLRDEISSLNIKQTALQAELDSTRHDLFMARSDHSKGAATSMGGRKQSRAIDPGVDGLKMQMKNMLADNLALSEEVRGLKARLNSVGEDEQTILDREEAIMSMARKLIRSLKQPSTGFNDILSSNNLGFYEFTEELNEIFVLEMDAMFDRLTTVESVVESLNKRLKEQSAASDKVLRETKEASGKVMKEAMGKHQSRMSEKNDQISSLRRELSDTKSNMDTLQNKLVRKDNNISSMEADLSFCAKRIEALEAAKVESCREFECNARMATEDLHVMQAELYATKKALAGTQAAVTQLKVIKMTLEGRFDTIDLEFKKHKSESGSKIAGYEASLTAIRDLIAPSALSTKAGLTAVGDDVIAQWRQKQHKLTSIEKQFEHTCMAYEDDLAACHRKIRIQMEKSVLRGSAASTSLVVMSRMMRMRKSTANKLLEDSKAAAAVAAVAEAEKKKADAAINEIAARRKKIDSNEVSTKTLPIRSPQHESKIFIPTASFEALNVTESNVVGPVPAGQGRRQKAGGKSPRIASSDTTENSRAAASPVQSVSIVSSSPAPKSSGVSGSQSTMKRLPGGKVADNASVSSFRRLDSVDESIESAEYNIWGRETADASRSSGEPLVKSSGGLAASSPTSQSERFTEALERTVMGHEDFRSRLLVLKAKRAVQILEGDSHVRDSNILAASTSLPATGKLSKRLQTMVGDARASTDQSDWLLEDSQATLMAQSAARSSSSSSLEADADFSLAVYFGQKSVEEIRRQICAEAIANRRIEAVLAPQYRDRIAEAGSDMEKFHVLLGVLEEQGERMAHEREAHELELGRLVALVQLLESVIRTRDQTIGEKNTEVSVMTTELLNEAHELKEALRESVTAIASHFKPSLAPIVSNRLLNRKGVLFTDGSHTEVPDPIDPAGVKHVFMQALSSHKEPSGTLAFTGTGTRPKTAGLASRQPRTKEQKLVRLASTLVVTPVDKRKKMADSYPNSCSYQLNSSLAEEVAGSYIDGLSDVKNATEVLRQLRKEIAGLEKHN